MNKTQTLGIVMILSAFFMLFIFKVECCSSVGFSPTVFLFFIGLIVFTFGAED
jgi:hypothetical protein